MDVVIHKQKKVKINDDLNCEKCNVTSLFVFVGGTIFYIFVGAIISKPLTELAGWL